MKLAVQIASLLCMACLGAAGLELALLAHQWQSVDLNGSLTHLNGVLDNANGVLEVAHDAESKQAAFFDPARPGGATQQLQRTLVDLKHLIGTTDRSLNGDNGRGGAIQSVSEGLGATLSSTQRLTTSAAESLSATTEKLNPILASLAISSNDLAQQSPPILANVLETSKQVAIITKNSADSTAEIDMTAHDLRQVADAFRSDYLRPKNRLWFYLKTIIGLGAQAGDISKL